MRFANCTAVDSVRDDASQTREGLRGKFHYCARAVCVNTGRNDEYILMCSSFTSSPQKFLPAVRGQPPYLSLTSTTCLVSIFHIPISYFNHLRKNLFL